MKVQIILLVSLACAMVAFADETPETSEAKEKICEPGSTFKRDCNSCVCNAHGTDAACDKQKCIPEEDSELSKPVLQKKVVCEPGSTFKRDCNQCHCNLDGTDAACEKKLCPPSKESGEEHKPETSETDADHCEPGSTFMNKCNTCTCPETGKRSVAACTLIECPE